MLNRPPNLRLHLRERLPIRRQLRCRLHCRLQLRPRLPSLTIKPMPKLNRSDSKLKLKPKSKPKQSLKLCVTLFLNSESRRNSTALITAATHGRLEVVQQLLSAGAIVDYQCLGDPRCTALNAASRHGELRCVASLVRHRARVNLTTVKGATSLGSAVLGAQRDTVELLLSLRADPHAARTYAKCTSA